MPSDRRWASSRAAWSPGAQNRPRASPPLPHAGAVRTRPEETRGAGHRSPPSGAGLARIVGAAGAASQRSRERCIEPPGRGRTGTVRRAARRPPGSARCRDRRRSRPAAGLPSRPVRPRLRGWLETLGSRRSEPEARVVRRLTEQHDRGHPASDGQAHRGRDQRRPDAPELDLRQDADRAQGEDLGDPVPRLVLDRGTARAARGRRCGRQRSAATTDCQPAGASRRIAVHDRGLLGAGEREPRGRGGPPARHRGSRGGSRRAAAPAPGSRRRAGAARHVSRRPQPGGRPGSGGRPGRA